MAQSNVLTTGARIKIRAGIVAGVETIAGFITGIRIAFEVAWITGAFAGITPSAFTRITPPTVTRVAGATVTGITVATITRVIAIRRGIAGVISGALWIAIRVVIPAQRIALKWTTEAVALIVVWTLWI